MNERMQTIHFLLVDPTDTNGPPDVYFEALCDMTIVGVVAHGSKDDGGASTVAISDDGSAVISSVSCADADVPGTWQAKGYGGSNTPVTIAKDSLVKVANTGGDAGIAVHVTLYVLLGVDWK